MDAALNAGDLNTYMEMQRKNLAAASGGSSSSSSSSSSNSSSSSTSTEKSTSTSREFVDYMNQKRAEAGLSALAW